MYLTLGVPTNSANFWCRCTPVFWTSFAAGSIGSVQTALFSALRLCATWNRSYTLFAIVLVLSLAPFIRDSYAYIGFSIQYMPPPVNTCLEVFHSSSRTTNLISLIIADLLVLVLTWIKTYALYKESQELGIKCPLAKCMIHDGTTYFAALMVLSIMEILASYNSTVYTVFSSLVYIFPPMLVYRFLMGLRLADKSALYDVGGHSQPPTFVSGSEAQSIVFANIGELLDIDSVLED
ncbi:hypothetical protein PsYK624_011630 [Phanerochaete sordida]|uniref:Uncharacterized protein n=1 Tax=Phanerochaete sordida TaxID=48140 RepID=A0A9P3FYS6_9APHY|nr:hypothetical protein PsYK624_011630 [Phanerochaete sordida]